MGSGVGNERFDVGFDVGFGDDDSRNVGVE